MKNLIKTAITLTAIGVAVKVVRRKCVVCKKVANLEFETGKFICENCAQIQGELSEI